MVAGEVVRHCAKILTRHGLRGEAILAPALAVLRSRYGVADPLAPAVAALRPAVRYAKPRGPRGPATRRAAPTALFPRVATGIALRWIVDAAGERTYTAGGRPDIVRGLVDEVEAVLAGTSPLYAKKLQMHRNPN